MNIEIANRLIELRKKHGLSQEDLADKLGVSRQAVSKWETASASPDTDNLICLARIYGVSLDELLNTEQTIEEIVKDKKEDYKRNVRVGLDGIHIENHDDVIDINVTGVRVNAKKYSKEKKRDKIGGYITSIAMCIAIIGYFLFSIFLPLWVEGWGFWWLLFVAVPIPEGIYRAITKRKLDEIPAPLISTIVFFCLGFIWNLWHPGWVAFLFIPLYYAIVEPIDRAHRKDLIDIDEEVIETETE